MGEAPWVFLLQTPITMRIISHLALSTNRLGVMYVYAPTQLSSLCFLKDV